MLSDGNKQVLADACSRIREANWCLVQGRAYTASRCCRDAEERLAFVLSRSEVTAQEVDEFVKEIMAKSEEETKRMPTHREIGRRRKLVRRRLRVLNGFEPSEADLDKACENFENQIEGR